jgi:hypothetical protein
MCTYSFRSSKLYTQKIKRSGGGRGRCNTQQIFLKTLHTFGTLGAMDFGHKKHKVEGGMQHATYEKKKLHALGTL